MKTHFLFPNKFKTLGWILFIPNLILGSILLISEFDFDSHYRIKVISLISDEILSKVKYFQIIENGILDEFILITIIIGGVLIGFSKTKNEDEFISKIRYESLIWATYLNFALLLLACILIYEFPFFYVLLVNVFAMLLFFIIRFHYMIYLLNKTNSDDE